MLKELYYFQAFTDFDGKTFPNVLAHFGEEKFVKSIVTASAAIISYQENYVKSAFLLEAQRLAFFCKQSFEIKVNKSKKIQIQT